MSQSKRIEVKEGERAEVCVRSKGANFTLVINGPGSLDVVISSSLEKQRTEETRSDLNFPAESAGKLA